MISFLAQPLKMFETIVIISAYRLGAGLIFSFTMRGHARNSHSCTHCPLARFGA